MFLYCLRLDTDTSQQRIFKDSELEHVKLGSSVLDNLIAKENTYVRILRFLISQTKRTFSLAQTSTTLVAKRVLTKETFSCAIDLNKLILH